MREKGSFLPIAGVVLLVVVVAFGAYFLRAKKDQSASNQIALQAVSSPATPKPSPSSETANWNTYVNTKYKFTFKYPANANIVGDAENINYDKATGQIISVDSPSLDLTVSYDLTVTKESIIKATEIITLNNQQWNVLVIDPKGGCPPGLGPCTSVLEYQAAINNKLITFTFRGNTDKTVPNQILSTFKFTDQN